jgi:hypothetical protein
MKRSTNHPLVVAAFDTRVQAERAMAELRHAGFRDDQIGMAMRDCEAQVADAIDERAGHRAEEGMAAGAVVGTGLGAAIALLIPGFGPVIAWGILTVALEGALLGAAAGGLVGGLTGLGATEEDAHFCERAFRDGRPVVIVRANRRRAEARKTLLQCGGYDLRASLGR